MGECRYQSKTINLNAQRVRLCCISLVKGDQNRYVNEYLSSKRTARGLSGCGDCASVRHASAAFLANWMRRPDRAAAQGG